MSREWGDVNAEDRQVAIEKVAAVLKEEGMEDKVKIKSLDQFVTNLSAGEKMN